MILGRSSAEEELRFPEIAHWYQGDQLMGRVAVHGWEIDDGFGVMDCGLCGDEPDPECPECDAGLIWLSV